MTAAAPDLTPSFYRAWVTQLLAAGLDPFAVARVAYAETGMRQRATDASSNAGGIFPFMPATLKGLGWTGTPEEFRNLTPEQQVPYVVRYLKPYAPSLKNDGLVYVATFLPAYLKAASAGGDSYAFPDKYYKDNAILDRNHDGVITVGDLRAHLAIQDVGARYEEIAANVRALAPAAGLSLAAIAGVGLVAWGAWSYFRSRKR